MAGVTKIGQHEVTEIKRDAAQVGCTRVTRAEVEQLLKQMDSAPNVDFNIVNAGSYDRFTKFTLHFEDFGSAAASEKREQEYGGPFGMRSVSLCLRRDKAEALFAFLGGALHHDSYTPENSGYKVLFQKV